MLVWSPIWLRRFRFGPVEWAWRSLTRWERQPLRLKENAVAEPQLVLTDGYGGTRVKNEKAREQ